MMLNAPPRGICVTLNEHNLARGVPGTSRSSGLAVRDLISSQPIVKSLDRSSQSLFAEHSSHWNVTFIRIHCFVSSLDLNLHSTVYWINYVFQLNEKSTDSRIHCSLQFSNPSDNVRESNTKAEIIRNTVNTFYWNYWSVGYEIKEFAE